MAVSYGTSPSIDDVRRAFQAIVAITDDLKHRSESVGQWAQIYTAQNLVDMWIDPATGSPPTLVEAQDFLDTAKAFSAMVDNTLNADPSLGLRVVKIRPIG